MPLQPGATLGSYSVTAKIRDYPDQAEPRRSVVAFPVLRGRHHDYRRAA